MIYLWTGINYTQEMSIEPIDIGILMLVTEIRR